MVQGRGGESIERENKGKENGKAKKKIVVF